MTDLVSMFLDAMQSSGVLGCSDPIADGKIHRFTVAGDRPKSDNGWYVLFLDGDFAGGAFGSWKLSVSETWHAREGGKKITTAQRKRVRDLAEMSEAERQRIAAEVAVKAAAIWKAASPSTAEHAYAARKRITPLGTRIDRHGNLVVPVRNSDGELRSLQLIKPDGNKLFLTGGEIGGNWSSVGRAGDTMLICEGYATACTLHEACGLGVFIAFNNGNLPVVAERVRRKYPDAALIVCGDNDHKTEGNPGAGSMREAAAICKGHTLLPEGIKGTDFNDMAAEIGIDAVNAAIRTKLDAIREEPPAPQPGTVQAPEDLEDDDATRVGAPQPLGYDKGVYYYYSMETRQVEQLTPAEHTPRSLMHLASEAYFWSRTSFQSKNGVNYNDAADWMMHRCRQKGIFNIDRIRGRGAWLEGKKAIVHFGDRLVVDGKTCNLSDFSGGPFLYQAATPLVYETPEPLSKREAHRLQEICELINWRDPLHAKLLAGWIALAPICGALNWRASIWITGASGSGKTWIMTHIIKGALRDVSLMVSSGTTEAALRQKLDSDALPVVFDEAEGEKMVDAQRMDAVLQLVRQSSSEQDAAILKGSQNQKGAKMYRMRSCFAFMSINVGLVERADESRITVLPLESADRSDPEQSAIADDNFEELERLVRETITPDFSSRLIMRSARLIPVIRKNHDTFSRAVGSVFGDRRAGDQLGALLAGAYSLTSEAEITYDAARAWIETHSNLKASTVADEQTDEERFLSHVKQAMVRVQGVNGHGVLDRQIGELMDAARTVEGGYGMVYTEARQTLMRCGIRYQSEDDGGEGFWISHSSKGLKNRILKDAPAWGRKPALTLSRIRGAVNSDNPIRFAGDKERATFLPWSVVKGDDDA